MQSKGLSRVLPNTTLQTAEKRREAKGKGEKERYTHLNAEFQRLARRDKKAFLSDQCKEIEETVADFILFGSKITADGDLSHEIKRCLLLGRKAMTNLDSILKSRDITLPGSPSRQGYGFSSSHVLM